MPIIFLGFHTFTGETGGDLSPGLRLGTILGGRLSPQFSINGELTLDFLNPKNEFPGTAFTAVMVDIALSPFFHIPSGNIEFVVGPKLGLMSEALKARLNGQDAGKGNVSGYVYGINAGAFADLSPSISLGAIVSFVGRSASKSCFTRPGFDEVCSTSNLGDAFKVLSVSAGLMF